MPAEAQTSATATDNFDADIAAMIGNNYEAPAKPAAARDDSGRFARTANDAELVEDGAAEVKRGIGDNKGPELEHEEPAKPAEAKDAKADAAAEDDEDYIELPPEEDGKEPTRLKLGDVLTGYRERDTLKAEVEKLRAQPALPAEVEEIVVQSQQARAAYVQQAQELLKLMQPQLPSEELVNPNSPNYNPELYYQQFAQAKALINARNAIKAEAERAQQEHAAREAELTKVRLARVAKEVMEVAPEFKDPNAVKKFYADVSAAYGFSSQELDAIGDARVVRVLKDALAGRQSKATAETVKKAVATKPKLVRAQARQTSSNGKVAKFQAASERVSRSGSLEDGAAAIAHLIS